MNYNEWTYCMYLQMSVCHNLSIGFITGTLQISLQAFMLISAYMLLDRLHFIWYPVISLPWRHNERDSVSNHQPHDCLFNCLFRRRSKKTSKLRVTGLMRGIHRGPVNSPHKLPVTRKMFPFHDVIMYDRLVPRVKLYNMFAFASITMISHMV